MIPLPNLAQGILMSGPTASPITLSSRERTELRLLLHSDKKRQRQRAEIVLLAASGHSNAGIARELGISETTSRKWRDRFASKRLPGLQSDKRVGRPKESLELTQVERHELERLVRRATVSQRLAGRARIVLLCAEGVLNTEAAAQLGCSSATVGKWRQRFVERRLDGLYDEPRPGGPRTVSDEMVEDLVVRTLETTPKGATHWSTRSMAKHVEMSSSTIGRIWRAFGLQPHRSETFQLSTDPLFVEKVRDVVGLYMEPPDHALVLSVDEKSQIQALNRTQPVLPFRPGQLERRTPEYSRNGTTSLFAALDVATGHVIGKCYSRHRAIEFRKFLAEIRRRVPEDLDVHIIVDNYATHSAKPVQTWLKKNPRFQLHFIPTHSSWLNEIEAWFSILTTRQIKRGSHHSVDELKGAIYDFIEVWNEEPQPFKWTKSADEILESVARYCYRTLTAHPDPPGSSSGDS